MYRTIFRWTTQLKKTGPAFSNKSLTRQMVTSSTSQKNEKKIIQTTVIKDEVKFHSNLKDKWWNPRGPMKLLFSMNLLRVPFIRDGLMEFSNYKNTPTPLKGLKIMDVGCGGGILSEALSRLGADVTGIDASSELIEVAKIHSCGNSSLGNNLPEYICSSVEDHAEKNANKYHGVVASEIIEHIHNKDLFIRSCVHTLKPGGRFFCTTPTRTKVAHFFGIFVAENILQLLPKGTHHFEQFTTPTDLSFMLDRNNCQVEIVHGAFYNFITDKWSFADTQAFMFFLQAKKIRIASE